AHHVHGLRKSGGPDRFGGLVGALQIARVPHRVARQDLCNRLEHFTIAAIAFEVLLAVDVAAVAAYRRMTYPPTTRYHHLGLVVIGHRQNPLHQCRPASEPVSSYARAHLVSSGFDV